MARNNENQHNGTNFFRQIQSQEDIMQANVTGTKCKPSRKRN